MLKPCLVSNWQISGTPPGREFMLFKYCVVGWMVWMTESEPTVVEQPVPVAQAASPDSAVDETCESPQISNRSESHLPPVPSEDGRTYQSGVPRSHLPHASRTVFRIQAMAQWGSNRTVSIPRLVSCCHPPLFEDSNLERSGVSSGHLSQPVLSGTHFFGSVGVLPLKLVQGGPRSSVFPQDELREASPTSRIRNLLSPAPGFERQR